MQDTAEEARMNSEVTFSYEPLNTYVPVLADQPEITKNNLCNDINCSLEDLPEAMVR